MITIRRAAPLALLVLGTISLLAPSPAQAGKGGKIDRAFRGQILVTSEPLPEPDGTSEKATIKQYKSLHSPVITSNKDDGIAVWNFHVTAFAKKKPKTGNLSLEFYTDDKEKLFVADKRLTGADPSLTILATSVRITEDENLNRGRKYILKLVAQQGKKSVTIAQTKIETK